MKRLIFALVLLLLSFCSPVFAMDESEVVSSFQQYVDSEMAQVIPTYNGNHYNMEYADFGKANSVMKDRIGWYKATNILEPGYQIDVQKTNSLVSPPYIGTLKVKIRYVSYQTNKSKAIAEQGKNMTYSWVNTYLFNIAYQDGSWKVKSVKHDDGDQHDVDNIVNVLSCMNKIRN